MLTKNVPWSGLTLIFFCWAGLASAQQPSGFEPVDVVRPPSREAPVITSYPEVLKMGEQFTLRVENPPAGTVTFAWDLQGDGQADTETNAPVIRLEPDAPGVLPVRVMFINATGGMRSSVNAEFIVESLGIPAQDLSIPIRIDVSIDGLKVNFKPIFDAPSDLIQLEPTWEFGDESKSYLLEPEHVYGEAGAYTVKLVLRDVETKDKVAEADANVVVRGSSATVTEPKEERDGGKLASFMKPFIFLFKVIVFVLFVLLLVTGVAFLVLLLKAKRKNVSVKDVVLEYKKKFSGEGVVGKEETKEIKEIGEIKEEEVIDVKEVKSEKSEPAPMKIKEEPKKEEKKRR